MTLTLTFSPNFQRKNIVNSLESTVIFNAQQFKKNYINKSQPFRLTKKRFNCNYKQLNIPKMVGQKYI